MNCGNIQKYERNTYLEDSFSYCLQNRNIEMYTEVWTNKRDLNGILDTLLGQRLLVMLVTVELNVGSSYYQCFSKICSPLTFRHRASSI